MNDKHSRSPDVAELSDDDVVAELIRRAGPRARAADYLPAEFKDVAVERWQGVVNRRRRRIWTRRAATAVLAAAAAVGFAAVALRLMAPAASGQPLALVERVAGELVGETGGRARRLEAGDTVGSGNPLVTNGTGSVALRLNNGIGVRLDGDTRAILISENRLELERGAIYVDSSGAPEAAFLDVATALGVARDIGTVYQVRAEGSGVRVQVRRGRVLVYNDSGRHEADAGTQLTLSTDGGVERSPAVLHGAEWSWIYSASPTFALEGASLADYLNWLGRETGWYVRFAVEEREALLQTRLHGSLEGVAPEQTPDLVLPGCGLTHRLEGGTIVLEPEDPELRTRA